MSDSGEFFHLQSRWTHPFPQEQDFMKEAEQGLRSNADPNIAHDALGPGSAFSSCPVTLQQWLSSCKPLPHLKRMGYMSSPNPIPIRLLDGSPNQNKIKYLKVLLNCKVLFQVLMGSQFKDHWGIRLPKSLRNDCSTWRLLDNYNNNVKCNRKNHSSIVSLPSPIAPVHN